MSPHRNSFFCYFGNSAKFGGIAESTPDHFYFRFCNPVALKVWLEVKVFMIGRNSRFESYLLTIFRFSTTGLNTATTTPLCTRFFARSCHPKTLENSSTSPRPTPATTTRAKEVKPSVQGFEAGGGRSKE